MKCLAVREKDFKAEGVGNRKLKESGTKQDEIKDSVQQRHES